MEIKNHPGFENEVAFRLVLTVAKAISVIQANYVPKNKYLIRHCMNLMHLYDNYVTGSR